MRTLKALACAVSAIASVAAVGSAQADCRHYGSINYYYTSATDGYFYISENSATPGSYTYFHTRDHDWMRVLTSAQSARSKVWVTGTAASCGTGTYKYGGDVKLVQMYGQ